MEPLEDERTVLAIERTQLALERTFLSWLRTGLAGIGGGVALIRFVEFKTPWHEAIAYMTGILFVVWGIYLFLLAIKEYERSMKLLKKTDVRLNLYPRKMVVFFLVALCVLILLLVL